MQLRLSNAVRFSSASVKLADSGDSLYLKVRFSDAAAVQEGLRHDVSVGVAPQFIDGRGNVYAPALEHLAATSKPVVPGLGGWEKDETDPEGLTYEKESLPAGDYYKQAENFSFSATDSYLSQLVENIESMLENGAPMPFQLTHDGDAGKLGDVIGARIGKRAKRLPPVKASNAKIPPRKPELLRLSQCGDSKVTLDDIIALLGLAVPAEASDEEKVSAITAELNALKQLKGQQSTEQPQQGMSAAATAGTAGTAGATCPHATAAGGNTTTAPASVTVKFSAQSIPASLVEATKRARETELSALISAHALTPAEKETIMKSYSSDEGIRAMLSASANGNTYTDPYDVYVAAVRARQAAGHNSWNTDGRQAASQQQAEQVLLSQGATLSPLAADRVERNKRFAEKY